MTFSQRLIAHRGWQRRYPENTLLAVEAALAAGAHHVEIDIQLTADQTAVIFHDDTLLRLCGVDQSIFDSRFAELSAFSASEPGRFGDQFTGTPISPLSELVAVMAKYPQATLYAEIKSESLNRFGHRTVLNAVMPHLQSLHEHCYVISFDLPVLLQARDSGWRYIAPVLESLAQLDSTLMTQLEPDMVFCDYQLLQAGDLRSRFAYPAALYEIDRYEDALLWFNEGAQLVETFAIGELMAADRGVVDG